MNKREDAELELQGLIDGSIEPLDPPEIIEERIQDALLEEDTQDDS